MMIYDLKKEEKSMKISNRFYTLELCETSGKILSYRNGNGREFIARGVLPPLFEVCLTGKDGNRERLDSDHAKSVTVCRTSDEEIRMDFQFAKDFSLCVRLHFSDESSEIRWKLFWKNKTEKFVDWVDFCAITAENRFGKENDFRVFLPMFDGVELDGFSRRQRYFPYREMEYPTKGWEGMYPSCATLQFMAVYGGGEGLYFGAHDAECGLKCLDCYEWEGAIRFVNKLFPGTEEEEYEYGFEYVTAVFAGDWHDAAERYRKFAEESFSLTRTKDNKALPEWVFESPIVVVYPIRGHRDTGDMSVNECYYPYTNAVPYLERLAKATDSKLMAMLCHWEGTAPWAPPFVWPPFGDLKNFQEFDRILHEKGMLLGLYCSGMGWTQKSSLIDYNREEFFEKEGMREAMCLAPDQSLPYGYICNGVIRLGYDMCVHTEKARKIMRDELNKMITGCKADYVQLFDQNIGGSPCICYSQSHGHPSTPGNWMVRDMCTLLDELEKEVKDAGRDVTIGCEGSAAEPYIGKLYFNDCRNYQGYAIGYPVPAYDYVYHEYISNFMGNQNSTCMYLYQGYNPQHIFFRTAQFFVNGNAMTVTLKGEGEFTWDWGTPWETPGPDQESYAAFLKELNTWRKNGLREELFFGRMVKPREVECGKYAVECYEGEYPLYATPDNPTKKSDTIYYPSVMSSAYATEEGMTQIFVNFQNEPQKILVGTKRGEKICICKDPYMQKNEMLTAEGKTELEIGPLQVAAIKIL